MRQADRDDEARPRLTTTDQQRLEQLDRENKELRRANEILHKTSAWLTQAELDRRSP